ncbi:hypothetical protein [Bacillus sp. AFS088145]|nr:hypothetical protein [Bacillus sp. AFS088145]
MYYAKNLEQTAGEGKYYADGLSLQAFALTRLGGPLNEIIELID